MKGSKRAFTKTTGKERVKMSVLMAATANGTKLDSLAIMPRKKRMPDAIIQSNVLALYDSNGNKYFFNKKTTGLKFNFNKGKFTSQLLAEHFVDRILVPYMAQNRLIRLLLICDQARCHISGLFKLKCIERKIQLFFIPPGLTSNFHFLDHFLINSLSKM